MADTITSVPGAAAAEVPQTPSAAPSDTPAFRRARPTVADTVVESPMPDFISSPGMFVKEQKPRPVGGGVRGAIYNMTGGAWNLGPGAKQRQEEELGRHFSGQLSGRAATTLLF